MVDTPARLCLVGLPSAMRSGVGAEQRPSGRRCRRRNGALFRSYAHRLIAAGSCADPAWGRHINAELAGGQTGLGSIGVVGPRSVRCRERVAHLALLGRRPHSDPATGATARAALALTAACRITLYASAARCDAASARLGSRAALCKTGGRCRTTPSTSDYGSSDGSTVAVAQSSSDRHR